MKTKDLMKLACIISSIMLLVAILPLQYPYYNLLRITVSTASAFLAFTDYQRRQGIGAFTIIFSVLMILFNPLIPVFLDKGTWQVIDAVAIIPLMAFMIKMRKI